MSTRDTPRQMSVMHISCDPLRRYASGKNSVIRTLMDSLKRYHVPAFFLAPPQYSYKRILQRGISSLVGRFNSDKAKTWHLLKYSINPLLGSLAKASDRVNSNSVFHTHDIIAAWVVLSSLGEKVPLVITVHSFGPPTAEFERQGYFRDAPETTREFKRIESLTFAQARIITTPSEASRSEILRLYPDLDPRKVRVVPNPVSPILFEQPPLQKTQLDLPEDCVVVFTAAALVKSKRIDLLLHIAKMVVDKCDIKPYFLIAGKGPELRRLKEIARKLGIYRHVLFPGEVRNVGPYLGASDIVVSTSEYENFPLTLAEGSAMGKPLVAFDVGGVSSIARNGLNAYVVKYGDLESYADYLCKLIENPDIRKRFGTASREVAEAFDLDNITRDYISIYNEVLRQT